LLLGSRFLKQKKSLPDEDEQNIFKTSNHDG